MHIHIDQGVNFSKLAKKYQNSKVGEISFGALWLHSGPLCHGLDIRLVYTYHAIDACKAMHSLT